MVDTLDTHHISSILKALIYIEEHLHDILELQQLAKIAGISPYYFHRLFRIYLKETVADYIKRLRVQRAAERLHYSNDPITTIALDVGYETPSSFSKAFNQMMGATPRQYRKSIRPAVATIFKNMEHTETLKPILVNREDEEILFVRKTGDYNHTPDPAFAILKHYLVEQEIPFTDIRAFYGVPLDDNYLVERELCRFDACAAVKKRLSGKGEVGRRILRGGRYALFKQFGTGTPDEIEETLDKILRVWFPSLKEESLGDTLPFFEFVHCLDKSSTEPVRQTNIYVPINRRKG